MDADLVVLPELFSTGYQFASLEEVAELAEDTRTGSTIQGLTRVCQDKKMHIAAGFAEKDGLAYYNSAVLTGPEGVLGVYRKTHLFYEEKLWFTPGNGPYGVYDIGQARIGLMVCFDWFFPEVARSLALAGAEIICHPANLVLPYCQAAMVTRCLENRVFAVTANRTGTEQRSGKKELKFTGSSQMVNPLGQILVRASAQDNETRVVEIDPAAAKNKKINDYNELFKDRRADLYRKITDLSL